MLQNIRFSSQKDVNDQDLLEARKWAQEAAAAEEADDWARAVVCYRRAIEKAPFCTEYRVLFEDALEEQILAQLGKRSRKSSPAAISRASREMLDDEQKVDDFEEEPEEKVAAPPRRQAPAAKVVTPKRVPRRSISSGRRMRWAAAASIALLLTTGGLFAASAASGLVKSIFGSDQLPSIVEASVPAPLQAELAKADELLRAQKPDQAADILRDAARMYPEHEKKVIQPTLAYATRLMALEQQRGGDYAKAADNFRKAAELDSQNALNWIDLGRTLRQQAQSTSRDPERQREILASSEEAFKKALVLSPHDTDALFGLAQVYSAKNNRQMAIETFERIVALAPKSVQGNLAQTNLEQLKKR
jgi:tetratricopeptide (TPR) repeat protein